MKIEIKFNTQHTDEFLVFDGVGNPVTGLVDGDFAKNLYNPSGAEVSGSVTVVVSELGDGIYRVIFTPNALGSWVLSLTEAGNNLNVAANYECRANTIDDVDTVVDDILTNTKFVYQIHSGAWKVDRTLKQMIFYTAAGVEIARFSLFDQNHTPNADDPYERWPV